MNTLINLETKQLLFDKGWRYELSESYDPELGGTRVNHSLGEQRWNEGKNLTYVDITISEVVMWLYEKHGIWINVKHMPFNQKFGINITGKYQDGEEGDVYYNSPTEAYEAAIEYTLNNLI